MGAALASAAAILPTLLLATPAFAAGATVQQPADDSTISSSVPVRVAVSRDLTEMVSSVVVRLSRDGASAAAGTEPAKLSCVGGCGGTSTEQVWGGVTLDPRAPERFGSTPLANGVWFVQPSLNDGSYGGGARILVSYEGSPVSGLAATADGADVALSWRRAPEPDITGYGVERRGESGSWTGIARLGPNANGYRDEVPSSGVWSYRVITERLDGSGGTYTTASITVEISVDPAPGEAGGGTGSEDPSETPDDGASGGSAGSDVDAASGDGDVVDDTRPAAGGSGGDSTSPPRSRRSGRVAPPPSVRRSAGVDADVPSVAAPRERYFGEDDEFTGELDYSGIPGVAGEEAPEPRQRDGRGEERLSAAVQEFVVGRLNTRSILVSVAAGLLFVTLGLHIYRWMQAS